MRQRRARTPSSTSASATPVKENSVERDSNGSEILTSHNSTENRQNVLPDLLPRTFHLAESSSLFSQFNEHRECEHKPIAQDSNEQPFSVVAIRETNLSELKKPTYTGGDRIDQMHVLTPRVSEINTVTILEKVEYFEPEFVETVNIIDATSETSDTDTCTTPVFDEPRNRTTESFNHIDPDRNDYDIRIDNQTNQDNHSPKVLRVERKKIIPPIDRISTKSSDDRDLLLDSELDDQRGVPLKPSHSKMKSVVPGLNTALSSMERNSFYNSDNENFDEPLIFSDDDDAPIALPSDNLSTDYDSDDSAAEMVFIFKQNQFFFFKQEKEKYIYI